LCDLLEYKTGANPLSAASPFSAHANVSPGAGQVTLTWEAAPGRSYRVQYKDDLSQTQWSDLSGGVGVYGVMATCVDTAGAFNQRFYRVALVE